MRAQSIEVASSLPAYQRELSERAESGIEGGRLPAGAGGRRPLRNPSRSTTTRRGGSSSRRKAPSFSWAYPREATADGAANSTIVSTCSSPRESFSELRSVAAWIDRGSRVAVED